MKRRQIMLCLAVLSLLPCLVGEAWSNELIDCRKIGDFVYDIDAKQCVAASGSTSAVDLMAPLLTIGNIIAPGEIGQNATLPDPDDETDKKDSTTGSSSSKTDDSQCDSRSYMSGCADGSTYCTLIPGRQPPAQLPHIIYFCLSLLGIAVVRRAQGA
jgi:hypothetical protein